MWDFNETGKNVDILSLFVVPIFILFSQIFPKIDLYFNQIIYIKDLQIGK